MEARSRKAVGGHGKGALSLARCCQLAAVPPRGAGRGSAGTVQPPPARLPVFPREG